MEGKKYFSGKLDKNVAFGLSWLIPIIAIIEIIIDKDVLGNPITRADQVARCGNAVCPAVAEALVRANLPECCKVRIEDMEELHRVMTS